MSSSWNAHPVELAKRRMREREEEAKRPVAQPPPSSDPTISAVGRDMETADKYANRLQKWGEMKMPMGAAVTGRKERAKPSDPDWVITRARVKVMDVEKKRGRPTKPVPHPDFLRVFPEECYAPGTLNNKMSHIRAILRFVEFMGWEINIDELSVDQWRAWGIKMASAGISWTVLSYYMGTVRSFLGYKGAWGEFEMAVQAQIAWEQVKKASLRYKASQAPIILRGIYHALDKETQKIVLFAMNLGVRHASLMAIKPEHVMWREGGYDVHISEFKWMPEARGRVSRIECSCNSAYCSIRRPDGTKYERDETCIICNTELGLPSLPINENRYMERLRAHNLWGHSPRVTIATLIAAAAAQYSRQLDMASVYFSFGWTLPRAREGKKNKYAMFNRYASQADAYTLGQVIPAFGIAANIAGFYSLEASADRSEELDSGCEDFEEYEDEVSGKVVRIGAGVCADINDVEARIDHSLEQMEEGIVEGEIMRDDCLEEVDETEEQDGEVDE